MNPRLPRAVATVVAAMGLWLVVAPIPAWAESALSAPDVTPTSGTTETAFTFTVHYTSTDSPNRPAQAVWAQVGDVAVTLVKVSGTSHDGTWQGTSTLSPGTWPVTFHATTSSEPQPAPVAGPMVTVTEPPPTPEPPPPPTAEPEPEPLAADEPPPPAADEPAPLPAPRPPSPMQPPPEPQPTAVPQEADDPTASRGPSATSGGSGSTARTARDPSPTASEDGPPIETPESFDAAVEETDPPSGSRLAALLLVGGSMSIGGAAVLARQWLVSRSRPRRP